MPLKSSQGMMQWYLFNDITKRSNGNTTKKERKREIICQDNRIGREEKFFLVCFACLFVCFLEPVSAGAIVRTLKDSNKSGAA